MTVGKDESSWVLKEEHCRPKPKPKIILDNSRCVADDDNRPRHIFERILSGRELCILPNYSLRSGKPAPE
jgi:hypothetical protein